MRATVVETIREGGAPRIGRLGGILLAILGVSPCQAQSGGAHGKATAAPTLHLNLVKTPVAKGTLRAGFQVAAALPADAFQVKVGAATLRFFDLDQDGKLASGVDGMALDDIPFVVPIVGELLLHDAQYKVEFTGTAAVTLTPVELGPERELVSEASDLTAMRVRAGLKPLALDPASCADCRKHCDYVVQNGILNSTVRLSIHEEDSTKPGYTLGGAAAGKSSDILPNPPSLREALISFYSTVWHGVPLFDPMLERVGVAIVPEKVAMLYFVNQKPFTHDFHHPADGATGIPCGLYKNGETPNPVPGTFKARGCGFPILMRLSGRLGALEWAEVTDPKGTKVDGTFSSPAHPATPEWPSNSGSAIFVPAHPLNSGTIYRVRFKFESAEEPVTWSFTTEGSRPRLPK